MRPTSKTELIDFVTVLTHQVAQLKLRVQEAKGDEYYAEGLKLIYSGLCLCPNPCPLDSLLLGRRSCCLRLLISCKD